jgi:hypothetical protein
MKFSIHPLLIFINLIFLNSCKKDDPGNQNTNQSSNSTKYVIFKFRFDSTQARLNNLGQAALIPAGRSAQHPLMNKMAAHYIELSPSMTTAVGNGKVLFHAPETNIGGSTAILHSQSILKGNGEEFFRIPLDSISPGTYNFLRVSVAYQNYDINYKYVFNGTPLYLTGTIASFVGYNTYINNYTIKNQTVSPSSAVGGSGNHLQGYWGFETTVFGNTTVSDGQAPPGATTVPNPIWSSSPIPQGSCLVTGQFPNPLVISGNETSDIIITVSFSTNKSFEWKDQNSDGWFEPAAGDSVVDMGLRGMIPSF